MRDLDDLDAVRRHVKETAYHLDNIYQQPDVRAPAAELLRVALDLLDEVQRLRLENKELQQSRDDWKELYDQAASETVDDLLAQLALLEAEIDRLRRQFFKENPGMSHDAPDDSAPVPR